MQLLLEKEVREHGAYDDGDRAQRCHEDGGRKRVCSEIENLAKHHRERSQPPQRLHKVRISSRTRAHSSQRGQPEALLFDDERAPDEDGR